MNKLTREMLAWYENRYPGIEFRDSSEVIVGRPGMVASWRGEHYAILNLTTIDDGLVKTFDALTPQPFEHTHTAETYDEYTTADGLHRITVAYENGKFTKLQLRAYIPTDAGKTDARKNLSFDLDYNSIDEINQLIAALHAAVAGINKRNP